MDNICKDVDWLIVFSWMLPFVVAYWRSNVNINYILDTQFLHRGDYTDTQQLHGSYTRFDYILDYYNLISVLSY
jgi:hypothetical protein